MSSLQERKLYLQLWSFTTGPAVDVMYLYFEVKVLINTTFESFLNDPHNKHKLFHQCFPTIPCCQCANMSLAAPKKKGCLDIQQFDKLYSNSVSPQPKHKKFKGSKVDQHCLCQYSAKLSITVDQLDISLFSSMVQHCCPSQMNSLWRQNIKNVRNFLAHVGNYQVEDQDFKIHWKTLEVSTLGFAGEMGKTCEKMFRNEILQIQNSSTDRLEELIEKSSENQIKILEGFLPLQTTITDIKETAEMVIKKQETHDEQFDKIHSSLGDSKDFLTEMKMDIGEVKFYMQKAEKRAQEEEQEKQNISGQIDKANKNVTSSVEKIKIEPTDEDKHEPVRKKQKTSQLEEKEISEGEYKISDFKDSSVLVDRKQALQKLGEIPLIDFKVKEYKKYLRKFKLTGWNFNNKIFESKETTLNTLVREKKQRTLMIRKFSDVIHNQEQFTSTEKAYHTDLGFLDVEYPSAKCSRCQTEKKGEVSQFCEDCEVFCCNGCVVDHRMTNTDHKYNYPLCILRGYELKQSWIPPRDIKDIIEIKYLYPGMVAMLKFETECSEFASMCTNSQVAELTNIIKLLTDDRKSRISSINDSMVAVTVPNSNLIHIVKIKPTIVTNDLRTPAHTTMTGGIVCRKEILYVAFSDAIRLMNLSGEIQRIINIPSVNILHSVNNDTMLCVHSQSSYKSCSRFDFASETMHEFENFPFHPEDVTTDDRGNIIFIVDGVIWWTDSDAKNVRIIASPNEMFEKFKKLTYDKNSKLLITITKYWNETVQLYRQL